MFEFALILISTLIVSLIAFIGVIFISLNENILRKILMVLIGFSSGALLGGSFLHLLPESLKEIGEIAYHYILLGIISFFFMEKFLYWRHCHDGVCSVHTFTYLNLIGDSIHNFIDGAIIAATFLTSYNLGIITTLNVVFHEIPQEIGDFGVLVYGGLSKKKALMYNFLSAITAIIGAIITYFIGSTYNVEMLVPFAAGVFIYIAATDLMPELHKRNKISETLTQLLAIIFGVLIFLLL